MGKGIILAESRNINSRVFRYTQFLTQEFKLLEVIDPLNYNMSPCTGCKECFSKGECPLDIQINDKGAEVKRKLINADIIIIISPVYAHNVTSDFKLLVDRISYWLHIFKLLGKPFIILTTTASNGETFVNNYINKIFSFLGACRIYNETFFESDSFICEKEKLESIVAVIRDFLDGKIEIEMTLVQEKIYQAYKDVYSRYPKESYEYKYWLENGFFDQDTLQDLYIKNR